MSLSIPEFPPDTVDREHARHLESRNDLVLVGKNVPLLVAEDGAHDPDLQQRGQRLCCRDPHVAGAQREDRVTAVLIDSRYAQLEVAPRKAVDEVACEVDLGPALVLWLIRPGSIPTRDPGVHAEPASERSTDGGRSRSAGTRCFGEKERIVD